MDLATLNPHHRNPYEPPSQVAGQLGRAKNPRCLAAYTLGAWCAFVASYVVFEGSIARLLDELSRDPKGAMLALVAIVLVAFITSLGPWNSSVKRFPSASRFLGGMAFGFSPHAYDFLSHQLLFALGWVMTPVMSFRLFWITILLAILTGIICERVFQNTLGKLLGKAKKADKSGTPTGSR